MFSNNEIARYYELSEDHYRLFWNLGKSKSLHYGYWDDSTNSFHEALLNINKVLSGLAEIRGGEQVLDAGCGVGGSSLWLAREKKCMATGISLSGKQVSQANAFAAQHGLSTLASFEQRDFTCTGYAPASFDVVWAIESVCHASDKNDFIREAFRVLKPGGRLVMADFFKKQDLRGQEAEIIRRWAHGWAVPDFSTIEMFAGQLAGAGFAEVNVTDATEAIVPSAKRLYRAYFPGWLGAKLYQLFHPRASASGRNNVDTALLQYKGLRRGLWKYKLIKAVKPG